MASVPVVPSTPDAPVRLVGIARMAAESPRVRERAFPNPLVVSFSFRFLSFLLVSPSFRIGPTPAFKSPAAAGPSFLSPSFPAAG